MKRSSIMKRNVSKHEMLDEFYGEYLEKIDHDAQENEYIPPTREVYIKSRHFTYSLVELGYIFDICVDVTGGYCIVLSSECEDAQYVIFIKESGFKLNHESSWNAEILSDVNRIIAKIQSYN